MVNNEDKEIIHCASWSIAPISANVLILFFLNTMTTKLYLQGQGGQGIQASFTEQRICIPFGMN